MMLYLEIILCELHYYGVYTFWGVVFMGHSCFVKLLIYCVYDYIIYKYKVCVSCIIKKCIVIVIELCLPKYLSLHTNKFV